MSENNFPEVQFSTRVRQTMANPSHTPTFGTGFSSLSRAEQLGDLSYEEYCQLSQRRILSARSSYARWCVRRVLFWAERMRAPLNKQVSGWYRNGYRTNSNGGREGKPELLTEKIIYNDWRVLAHLKEELVKYQCPPEHIPSAERLIQMRLAVKWGIR